VNAHDEDEQGNGWHNQASVVWAAGVAAVLLVGVLIYAVVQMSGGSTTSPPAPGAPLPTYATSSSTTSSTSSTSYAPPSVQTSELVPGAPTTAASDSATQDAPDLETSTPATSTTIYNPYVTTTQPAAGHI
jgi:cytoskeletal protein RodZ